MQMDEMDTAKQELVRKMKVQPFTVKSALQRTEPASLLTWQE